MTFKSMNGEISLQPDAVYRDCIKDQFLTIFMIKIVIPTLSVSSLMTTKKWFIQTKTNDFN